MFLGSSELLGARQLWHVKAPGEHKFFGCLVLQDRCWTTKRRHRHGFQSDSTCVMCDQCPKAIRHLLLGCVYSREVWALVIQPRGWGQLACAIATGFFRRLMAHVA
jgi:hypothetical protein